MRSISSRLAVLLALCLGAGILRGQHLETAIRVGDSVRSRLCLARDGWARWREFKVDYGRERLRYRLPFLNPNCIYRMRAVFYHADRDTWSETFSLDGRTVGRFSYRGLTPETIWVTIPPELYREDCEVTLDVSRSTGTYASLAGLTVYQRYPYRRLPEGGLQASRTPLPATRQPFAVVGPSLSRWGVTLAFALKEPVQARLRVYDLRGAVVKALPVDLRPGHQVVVWDGTGSDGRNVPNGAYFCRLEADGTSQVRKVVLTR